MAVFCAICNKRLDDQSRGICPDCYQDELEGRG